MVANELDDYHLYWSSASWMDGSPSSSSGAYPRDESFSSFEVMDNIITHIIYSEKFPNLTQIVLTGFSGGGQFVNRYAASNRVIAIITLTSLSIKKSSGKNIGNITEDINRTVIKGTPLQNSI